MVMLKYLVVCSSAIVSLLALTASTAAAAPVRYFFEEGSVTLRATLEGDTTSVLEGTNPVVVLLGGSFVDYDADDGTYGTLTMLELEPIGDFQLDLNESLVGLDMIEVTESMLTENVGATAAISEFGEFALDTLMTGFVEGIGTTPFPRTFVSSQTSSANGTLGITGDMLTLGLVGVNLASFDQLNGQPGDPQIVVKADFTFIGVVPEPGTALLLGLGLAGLAADRRRARAAG